MKSNISLIRPMMTSTAYSVVKIPITRQASRRTEGWGMAERYVAAPLDGSSAFGEAYFFLLGQYTAYHWGIDRVVDGVRPIAECGVPAVFNSSGSDTPFAALNGKAPSLGKAYFFTGPFYAHYNLASAMMETSRPLPIIARSFPQVLFRIWQPLSKAAAPARARAVFPFHHMETAFAPDPCAAGTPTL
jgi:hypothetical protein